MMTLYMLTHDGRISAHMLLYSPTLRTSRYVGISPPEKYIVNTNSFVSTFLPHRSRLDRG